MYRINHSHSRSGKLLQTTIDDDQDLKDENTRLKKNLKQLTANRNIAIKHNTELTSNLHSLQEELDSLKRRETQKVGRNHNQGYRIEELHFLNRELNAEIEHLRAENRELLEKYKKSTQTVEVKYEELERNTFKKIELAMKRVKKTVMYLTTLSGKEIEKTRGTMVENLEKSLELLKGKHLPDTYEEEVLELLNPIATLKEQLTKKDRDLKATKLRLEEIQESYCREEKMNKNILPQYKLSIEELQKNLTMSRSQVAEMELEKLESRRKYEIRIKEVEDENRELVNSFTKLKLERKLYADRIKEIEGEAEEEKERLIDENQMLKALYKPKVTEVKTSYGSSSNLWDIQRDAQRSVQRDDRRDSLDNLRKSSKSKLTESKYSERESSQASSSLYESQNTLKHQIQQIDKDLYEIQNNILKELQVYKHK